MGSSKTKMRLEDSLKFLAFLDIEAKINVITREVIKDAGLAMR